MNDDSVAHCSDGRLAPRQTFVVTEVRYHGTSAGDSNGHGEFLVSVAGEVIAHSRDSHLPTEGVWRGRLEVRAGEESEVFVEVANSSTGSAEVMGHVLDPGAPRDRAR